MTERRRSIRLTHYDYASAGAYFVTIATHERRSILGDGDIRTVVEDAWRQIPLHFPTVKVDEFVAMPNHMHGVIWITDRDREGNVGARHASPLPLESTRRTGVSAGSLGAIVGSFKAAVTKRLNEIRNTPGSPVWQRNYYEHVIRSEEELGRIREYIRLNPLKWEFDHENPRRVLDPGYERAWGWIEGNAKVGARHASPLRQAPQGRP